MQTTLEKIELKNDHLIDITNFKSLTDTEAHNKKVNYSEFVGSLQYPKITHKKGSYGGFVGGWVQGKRSKENVQTRSLITIDIDDQPNDDVWGNVESYSNFGAVMYSTHNSTREKPRYRLIVPLKYPIEPGHYESVTRFLVDLLHIKIDETAYEYSRIMYYPTRPDGSDYEFHHQDLPFFDPASIVKQIKEIQTFYGKKADPRKKDNWIGAWCNVYSITDVLHDFLSDVYEPFNDRDRHTYTDGSTKGGAVIYDNDTHLHSNHSTDPISGMNVNSFDLYRLHKYGHMDNGSEDMKDKPSYKAMIELCKRDDRVKAFYEDYISFELDITDNAEETQDVEVDPAQFFNEEDKFQHHKMACYLVKYWNIIKLDNRLHIYHAGKYAVDDSYIKRLIVQIVPGLKINQIREVMERLKLVSPIKEHAEPRYIGVKNGIYDIVENKLLSHDPSFIITIQLDADFDPGAKSKTVDSMFNLIGDGDSEVIKLFKEMIGYTLYRSNILEKIFILLGEGGNGKSTLINSIGILHGYENIESLSIQQVGDKFSTGLLNGKTVNIGDDIPFTSIKDTSVLKKLATGQRVNAEFKGVDGFNFENFAKLIFSTNKIPRFYDNSQGFNDRFMIVPLKARIRNTPNQDPNFKDKLKTDEAKSHLLNIGIKALYELLNRGDFITPYVVEQELEEFKIINDPIGEWLNEYEEDNKDIHGMPVGSAYTDYKSFCSYNGHTRHLTQKKLTTELKQHGYYADRVSIDGKQYRCYLKTNETLLNDNEVGEELSHFDEYHGYTSDNVVTASKFS